MKLLRSILPLLLLASLQSAPASAQMSTEQEVALGREASARFEAKYGLVQDANLQNRVARIGNSLVPYCGRTDIRYHFKVANMDAFNALAFPGGFIYCTRGLAQALDDEQLAFVLAHEITHVSHRHSVNQMSQDRLRQMGLLAALVALSGGRVTNGQAQVAGLVDKVAGSQHSQADESDADVTGIQMMAAAGYDPANAILALRTLASQSGSTPGFLNTFIGSHPIPADRVRDAYTVVPTVAYQPRAQARPSVGVNPPRPNPTASGVEREWTQTLIQDALQSGLGVQIDSLLSRQLEQSLKKPSLAPQQKRHVEVISGNVSLSAYETQFLSKDLPAAAQRGRRFGLTVSRASNGNREIHFLWP